MIKNFTLILFGFISLSLVKAQNWTFLSNDTVVNKTRNLDFDVVFGENEDLYLSHAGYTTETGTSLTKSPVISVLKYSNGVWDTLPNASDYYLNASSVFEMERISTKLAYVNNSIYLFYSENST